jgi:hypothetical protein
MVNSKIRAWEGRLGLITKATSGRGGRRDKEALISLCVSNGSKTKRKKDVLRITFHPRLMKMAGWTTETLLDIELMDGKGTIFPSPDGRPAKLLTKVATRTTMLYYFEAGALEGFPKGIAQAVECDKGIVAFNLPR